MFIQRRKGKVAAVVSIGTIESFFLSFLIKLKRFEEIMKLITVSSILLFCFTAVCHNVVLAADDDPEAAAPTFDGAAVIDGEGGVVSGGAPWFGATPPKKIYEMHRRGWSECLRCGGAERLGATLTHIKNVTEITSDQVDDILDAVRAHGIIVIKGQNLTRSEQVEFTSKLGEVIVLPSSFEGKDPEPYHPAIQRITNFWANNTWVRFVGLYQNRMRKYTNSSC